jgi:hypothetical protein
MCYIERKTYIDHIRLIGCPYIDQKWSNIDLKTKDRIEMLNSELNSQKKQITKMYSRIEQTVCKNFIKKKLQTLVFFPLFKNLLINNQSIEFDLSLKHLEKEIKSFEKSLIEFFKGIRILFRRTIELISFNFNFKHF